MQTDDTDFDEATSANDTGGPGDTLRPSEALDSGDVRNRDGDDVVDPPETWTEADKFGMTPREEREGESLDDKLAAEEPEPSVDTLADSDTTAVDNDTQLLADDEIDRVVPDDHGQDEGQVGGTPEDGDSIFPVVD